MKSGDDVLVSDFTFPATGHAVIHSGANPIFVDVSKKDWIGFSQKRRFWIKKNSKDFKINNKNIRIINFNKTNSLDEELFFSILNIMKQNTEKWQGNFILVYVPSWSRYFTKFNEDNLLFAQKEIIIDGNKCQGTKPFDKRF